MNFDFSKNYILENEWVRLELSILKNEWNDDVKSKLKNSIEK
ncbi:hypothetical protein [Chryseobacterium aahli]|nr:hypothetical protein [Chryseobacterium aahli]